MLFSSLGIAFPETLEILERLQNQIYLARFSARELKDFQSQLKDKRGEIQLVAFASSLLFVLFMMFASASGSPVFVGVAIIFLVYGAKMELRLLHPVRKQLRRIEGEFERLRSDKNGSMLAP